MESNNPNIEPFYTICNPKGFEGLLFSRPSSDYLLIEQAVRSYNPPFVLQNPAEAVANCIALNSPDWSAAKKNLPASASPQATRGLAVYHLQDGNPLIAIYSGRDPKLNLVLSHPELMGRTVPVKSVRDLLNWAGKHDALVEPVGRLELSVQEDVDGRIPFGMKRINQILFRIGEGSDHMADEYALARRELGRLTGIPYTISDFERAGVTSKTAALRCVVLGLGDVGNAVVDADGGFDDVGWACGVAALAQKNLHRK